MATDLLGATHVRGRGSTSDAPQINPNQTVPKEGYKRHPEEISRTDKDRDDDNVDTAPTLEWQTFKNRAHRRIQSMFIRIHLPDQDDASVVELVGDRWGSELGELYMGSDIQDSRHRVRIGAAYESVENLTRN